MTKIIAIVFGIVTLTSCDDDEHTPCCWGAVLVRRIQTISWQGTASVVRKAAARPSDQASFDSGVTTAKIDTDGNPLMQGNDPDWQAEPRGSQRPTGQLGQVRLCRDVARPNECERSVFWRLGKRHEPG